MVPSLRSCGPREILKRDFDARSHMGVVGGTISGAIDLVVHHCFDMLIRVDVFKSV